MRFDETKGRRADLALELLSSGKFINFRGLGLQLVANDGLECRVFSQWAPENMNSEIAKQEFAAGEETLAALLAGSELFASLLGTRSRTWELLYDYGQGAIRLCQLEGANLVWDAGWPKRRPAVQLQLAADGASRRR